MTTFIKGITLRYEGGKPFLTKLLDTSCVDSLHLQKGSIITTNNGSKYKVLDISLVDLANQDIILIVEDI